MGALENKRPEFLIKAGSGPSAGKESSPSASSGAKGAKEEIFWTVVGGGKAGGIVVRKEKDLKSEELGRIANGAKIKQKELKGERLHYQKVSGDGPDVGWVSLFLKGQELIK